MDGLLGRLLRGYPDSVPLCLTALSRQPRVETGKGTCRPRSFESLLQLGGVPAESAVAKPGMDEQFHLECKDEEVARLAEARLGALTIDDQQLMSVSREGCSLFAGCR